jgi:hypothetical protein
MQKAIIVYVSISDAYKPKNRPDILNDSLRELNDYLANGWSVKQSSPLGTGSQVAACNLVVIEKNGG